MEFETVFLTVVCGAALGVAYSRVPILGIGLSAGIAWFSSVTQGVDPDMVEEFLIVLVVAAVGAWFFDKAIVQGGG